jgi:hypothetical protein
MAGIFSLEGRVFDGTFNFIGSVDGLTLFSRDGYFALISANQCMVIAGSECLR